MIDRSTEVFAEEIKRQVINVGEETFNSPDDDWISALFFENGEGEKTYAPLSPELFATDLTKDMLVYVLGQILRDAGARRFALLLNAWRLGTPLGSNDEAPLSKEEGLQRAQAMHEEWSGHYHEHPESVEVLVLQIADQDTAQTWMAEIQRTETDPPTLSEWESVPGEGRFAALASALQDDA